MLDPLDPGCLKKYIERTYAAVIAAKNEYNYTFFPFQVVRLRLADLVSFFLSWIFAPRARNPPSTAPVNDFHLHHDITTTF